MTSFVQSPIWQTFQQALGRTTYTDSGDGWSYLATREVGTLNTRLYTPYGPAATDENAFRAALASLQARATSQGATFVRIEPTDPQFISYLQKAGWQPVTYQSLNPARTQIIDLSLSRDELLAQMSQNSRNLTRNYAKKGIAISVSTTPADITHFIALMRRVAQRNGIGIHSEAYFKTQAETLFPAGAAKLYLARKDGVVIAAAIAYDSDTTRYYAHAAADDAYRKFSPGTALLGQMILDAQAEGKMHFDLYGIAPENQPNHPWAGFTRFKQSFGGHPVDYAGTWDLPLNKPGYWLYRGYQTIRRKLR